MTEVPEGLTPDGQGHEAASSPSSLCTLAIRTFSSSTFISRPPPHLRPPGVCSYPFLGLFTLNGVEQTSLSRVPKIIAQWLSLGPRPQAPDPYVIKILLMERFSGCLVCSSYRCSSGSRESSHRSLS